MRIRKTSIALWCVLSAFFAGVTTSCIYDYDNCPDRIALEIKNNWQAAPSASPAGMAYIFFPDDGSALWRFDFIGTEAGQVELADGKYTFISHNDDTGNVMFDDGAGFDGYEAYTGTVPLPNVSGSAHAGDSMAVKTPEMLWGCAAGDVRICYCGMRFTPSGPGTDGKSIYSRDNILTAFQRPLTAHYTFNIRDVVNLSSVRAMSAALSGMAGSLFIGTDKKGRYPSTLSLTASPDGPDTIAGEFYTFGIPQSPDVPNVLTLYVLIKDGRKFCYEFDVTDQVRSAPDPMEVQLTLSGLTIEKPEHGDDAGFDVKVDGWITIVMNIDG